MPATRSSTRTPTAASSRSSTLPSASRTRQTRTRTRTQHRGSPQLTASTTSSSSYDNATRWTESPSVSASVSVEGSGSGSVEESAEGESRYAGSAGSTEGGRRYDDASSSMMEEDDEEAEEEVEEGEDEEMDAETAAGAEGNDLEDEADQAEEGSDGEDPLKNASDAEVEELALKALGISPGQRNIIPIPRRFLHPTTDVRPSSPDPEPDPDDGGSAVGEYERIRTLWNGAGKGDLVPASSSHQPHSADSAQHPTAGEREDEGLKDLLRQGSGRFKVPLGVGEQNALKDRVMTNLRRVVKNLDEDDWTLPPAPAFSPPSGFSASTALPNPAFSLSTQILDAHLAISFNPLAFPGPGPISDSQTRFGPSGPNPQSARRTAYASTAAPSTIGAPTVRPRNTSVDESFAADGGTPFGPPRYPWAGEDEDIHLQADMSLRDLLGDRELFGDDREDDGLAMDDTFADPSRTRRPGSGQAARPLDGLDRRPAGGPLAFGSTASTVAATRSRRSASHRPGAASSGAGTGAGPPAAGAGSPGTQRRRRETRRSALAREIGQLEV